jgi:phosphatidylinositol kinase/protein kinase (PI-3  family)
MRELHANKALITAIIEVFIHDPLYNWCVEDTTKADSAKNSDTGDRPALSESLWGVYCPLLVRYY